MSTTSDADDITSPERTDRGVPPAVAEAVRVEGVSKTFGSVKALDGVHLVVRTGTVHALVGENGSGKSTLTKVIAGAHAPDTGTVRIEGEVLTHLTPREAIDRGVRVIYQDLALFPNMSVAENIGFTGERPVLGRFALNEARERTREALSRLGLSIDPDRRLGDLSTAERQLVAIARAVSSDGRIILMDEPTASLTQREIDTLLESVRALAAGGVSFVFISHKLREVVAVADDVTVIRDGRIVATGPAADFDQDRIGFLMTGGIVENVRRTEVAERGETPVLEVRGLRLGTAFQDVDLELHRGRVLGLTGLVGCGKIEIGQAVAGLIPVDGGTILLHGRRSDDLRAESGLQYVPDDRLTEGLYLDWTITDNVVANNLHRVRARSGLMSVPAMRSLAEIWRKRLAIKTPSVDAPASSLSGGNQQRVLLARALAPEPDVVILNNPTVGVDIGSRAEIHDLVRRIADAGTSVLLISDEPNEVLTVSDEVAFVVDGRIVEVLPAEELTEERIIDINGGALAA